MREKAGGKVMRESGPVLLVPSVRDREIILEKGEILSEKRQYEIDFSADKKQPKLFIWQIYRSYRRNRNIILSCSTSDKLRYLDSLF